MLANLKGIFAPQAVAQSLKTLPPLESTIMDRFFKQRPTHPLSMLGITDLKAVVQTVPVVRRDGVPVPLDNESIETQFFAPLPIKVQVPVTAAELNDLRVLLGNQASLEAWRTRKVDQIRQAVHATTEGMCAGVLTTGKLAWPVQLPGGRSESYGIDYGAPLTHELATKLTGTSKLSDVYRLLRAMQQEIRMAGIGGKVEFMCGEDVAAVFLDMAENYQLHGAGRAHRHQVGRRRSAHRQLRHPLYGRNLPRAHDRGMGTQAGCQNADGRGRGCAGHHLVLRH